MKSTTLCLGAILLAATTSCKREREEVKTYRVAKETAAAPAPAADPHAGMPGGAMPDAAPGADPHAGLSAAQMAAVGGAATSPQITDSPPAHWKKQATTAMRQASYLVAGEGGATTDISLIILRGAAGGTLDNVNRWRGQLGQTPIDENTLKQSAQVVTTPVGPAIAVEIEGLAEGSDAKKDGHMIGVIADKDGDAWFYKMRGNAAVTGAEKANFMAWVQSVKPAAAPAPAATPGAPATPPPATTPGTPATPPPAATPGAPAAPAAAGDGSVAWELPAGWALAPAAGSMRYATIAIAGADGAKGELVVTHFPGDVGGDLANVNRWRQQVALPPIAEADLAAAVTKVTAGPKELAVIDVTGPQVRLTAGWTRHGADTWFFKFTGPDALVGAEKAKFTAFLATIRFTKPE